MSHTSLPFHLYNQVFACWKGFSGIFFLTEVYFFLKPWLNDFFLMEVFFFHKPH